MNVKLFVSDIDGTLLPEGGRVSKENIKAIRALESAGVHFVLATGRMYKATLPIAEQLGVHVPIIAYNGALIKSSAGEVIHTQFMNEVIVKKILTFFEQRNWHVQSYSEDELYFAKRDRYVQYYEDMQKITGNEVGWDGMKAHTANVTKLLSISGKSDELTNRMREIKKFFGAQVEVTRSNDLFAEFLAGGCTKAGAVKVIADKLSIDRTEIMAIGDSENDLPMLRSVGRSIAMGNAIPAVKKSSFYRTDLCENDGFAKAVYEYVLRG